MTQFSVAALREAVVGLVGMLESLLGKDGRAVHQEAEQLEEKVNALNGVLNGELEWLHGEMLTMWGADHSGIPEPAKLLRYRAVAEPSAALRGIMDRLQTSFLLPLFIQRDDYSVARLRDQLTTFVRELRLVVAVLDKSGEGQRGTEQ